jgi:hypothetical protein
VFELPLQAPAQAQTPAEPAFGENGHAQQKATVQPIATAQHVEHAQREEQPTPVA